MTKRGFGVFVLFALSLFFALATGYSEIFLAVFAFGFLIAFALASAVAGVLVLRAESHLTNSMIIRGDTAPIKVFWRGFLPLPAVVRLILVFPGGGLHKYAVMLWGGRRKKIRYRPVCLHRGIWDVGVKTAYSCDVMGLFCFKMPDSHISNGKATLTVYPHIFEIPGVPQPPVSALDYNDSNPRTSDSGDSFVDTRLYRDGDPLKRIHWKLSARTRKLHIKRYEMSVDRMVVILVDTSDMPMQPPEYNLDYADMATECAASLAYYFINGGHKVAVCPAGGTGGVILSSSAEFDILFNYLAAVEFNSDSPVYDAALDFLNNSYCISSLYVITREPAAGLIDLLSRMPAQGSVSLIYYDAACTAEPAERTAGGVNLIAVGSPNDIPARLGDMHG